MNDDSIELLPEEMRKRGELKKEEKRKEAIFVIPKKEEKELPVSEEKVKEELIKKKRSLFDLFKKFFRKKPFKKEEVRIPEIKKEEKMKIPTEVPQVKTPEVSLMPEKIIVTPKLIKKKVLTLIGVIIFCCLIVFTLSLVLNYLYQTKLKKVESLRQEIKKTESAISGYSELVFTLRILENKVFKIDRLLDNHIYFSKFFSALERYTLAEVYYKDLSIDTSGKLILPAVAKDLSSLLKQLTIFQNAPDFIKEVKFSSFTPLRGEKEERVEFKIELILVDDFLIK